MESVATEKVSCYFCRLVLAVFAAVLAASSATLSKDFVLYNTLEDGELETRIKWKDLTAKEVTVGRGLGITFRQLIDGKHFIQLIYDEDEKISDCEYLHQKQSVLDFTDAFRKDIHLLTTLYNSTIVELNDTLPENLKHWMNYKKLKNQCKKKHQELKKLLRSRARGDSDGVVDTGSNYQHHKLHQHRNYHRGMQNHRNHTIKPENHYNRKNSHKKQSHFNERHSQESHSSKNHSPENHSPKNHSHKIQIHKNHSSERHSQESLEDDSNENLTPEIHFHENYRNNSQENQSNHTHRHKNRKRRATTFDVDKSDNYLLFPGTLWCGRSDAADRYTSLGMMSGTDKCCRKHDYCKHNIPGFSYRHGMFNNRPFTLSECRCDMSFRACLKRVGTSDANLVGKLFFNVVQTKCFVFKPKKSCVQRSWWGKCQKKKFMKQAVLRDNMSY